MAIDSLVERLEFAKTATAKAEVAVDEAISQLRVRPRAEKVAMSRALQAAFAGLCNAKAELLHVEALLAQMEV